MNEFGVTINNNGGIVRHNHHLSSNLTFPNLPDDQVVNKLVVEISLWLIENEWLISVCEEERQHGRGSLARRSL